MKLFLFVCCNTPNPNQQGHILTITYTESVKREKNNTNKVFDKIEQKILSFYCIDQLFTPIFSRLFCTENWV